MKTFTKKQIISLLLVFAMLFNLVPFGAFTSKVYASSIINEIRITSSITSVNSGELPEINATTTTEHASIDIRNTGWMWWGENSSAWNSSFVEGTPTAVNDGKTHYAMSVAVDLQSGYAFDENTKIYFNDVDVTSLGHSSINAMSWGGYVIIDLGTAGAELPKYTISYDANGGTGTRAPRTVYQGESVQLGINTFTPPNGMSFKAWKIGDTEYSITSKYTPTENTIVKAVWTDKYIRESRATMAPSTISSDISANDLVFSSAEPSKYSVELWRVFDRTDKDLNTDNGKYPTNAKFVAGHVYAIEFTFSATGDYYEYDELDNISTFYLNNQETDISSAVAIGGSTHRRIELTATNGSTPTTYTVTFNSNGGSAVASQNITSGNKVTEPTQSPTKANYTFAGWYKNSGLTEEFNFDTEVITSNITIYAKWNALHTHNLTLVPAVSPTCSAAGNNAYYTCSGCTKVFKDALGNVETTVVAETLLIDANAHDWGAWTVTTPATEEADGEETRVCNHNASHTETQPIQKLTHTHTLTLVPAKEATCTEAGNNAYYTCSGCTKVFKDALGNVETTVVAETLPIDANAHDWNDWVETTPATVDTAGEKTRTCKHDPTHIQIDTIEKLALEITEGGNKTYTLDSGAKVQIKCNGTLANFDKLTSNGTDVDSSNYTKESGSTILTLKNTYLDTLSEGTYKLAFVYNDGRKAETNLTIAKANTPADTTDDDTNTTTGDNTTTDTTNTTTNTTDNTSNGTTTGGETKTSNSPKTGDNIVMYISIMLVSALGVAGTIKFIRKRA